MPRFWFVSVLTLLCLVVSVTQVQALVTNATPDAASCEGISNYSKTMKNLDGERLLKLAIRAPEVIPWSIGIDGNDLIGFGKDQWQSLAESYADRLRALEDTDPPPALLAWRDAEVKAVTALKDLSQRLAESGGIQIGFDEWPEYLALDPAIAAADAAAVAARKACPQFGDGPGLSNTERDDVICGEVDEYTADLRSAMETAAKAANLPYETQTLDVLLLPPSSLDPALSQALAREISDLTPPAVLTTWHSLLLQRLGYVPATPESTPTSHQPIADFDWYTNLAAYTCEEFPLGQR